MLGKGAGYIAQRIREIARERGIPVVENKPLAQLLYRQVDVGREIPETLYRAAAEVLAYVYRLRRGDGTARDTSLARCNPRRKRMATQSQTIKADPPYRVGPGRGTDRRHPHDGVAGAAVLLDLTLVMSISLSLTILIVSLYVKEPLDFSAFPSVLLFATLFRLALNVASVRLILLRGEARRLRSRPGDRSVWSVCRGGQLCRRLYRIRDPGGYQFHRDYQRRHPHR